MLCDAPKFKMHGDTILSHVNTSLSKTLINRRAEQRNICCYSFERRHNILDVILLLLIRI